LSSTKKTPLPESKSTWQSQFAIIYLLGIFTFSVFAFHRSLLDYTLLPRYGSASMVFLLTALFIGVKSTAKTNKIRWPHMDLPTGFLLGYVIWSTFSVLWATTFSEAIFESQKGMIGFAAFYCCRWFQLNDSTFISKLLKSISLISGIVVLLVVWQIFQVDSSIENAQYEIRGSAGIKIYFLQFYFCLPDS